MNKKEFINKIIELMKEYGYKRNLLKRADRLSKRVSSAKASLYTRSKKAGIEATITLDEMRLLTIKYIFKPDRYFPERDVTDLNLNYDHIIPLSKDGKSDKDNIQLITKYSNQIKSNLTHTETISLINNIKLLPEYIRDHTFKRLSSNNKY